MSAGGVSVDDPIAPIVGEPAAPAAPPPPSLRDNAAVLPLHKASSSTAIFAQDGYEYTVDYGDNGPAIVPNRAISFTIAVRNLTGNDFMGRVALSVPSGWQVAVPGAQGQRQMLAKGGMARYGFVIRVGEDVALKSKNE